MDKLGIVVLNYINYEDTIECVESIFRQENVNFHVIVVDNHSPNKSFEKLKAYFNDNEKITILQTESNIGFSRGNNVGIRYGLEKMNCQNIFILNSDTILLKEDMCKEMLDKYAPGVGIINPICVGLDGKIQQPYGRFTENLIFETFRIFFNIFSGTFQNLLHIRYGITNHIEMYEKESLVEKGYIIQGPAYILTKDFFKYYKKLFPNTFLYVEELDLAWYLKKVGLKTVIAEDAKIIHKEEGSTEFEGRKKTIRKFRFQLASFFRSIPVFLYKYEKISKKYN